MKIKSIILTVIITSVTLFCILYMNAKRDSQRELLSNDTELSIAYTITAYKDYLYIKSGDLFRESELVVIGTYDNYIKSYASLSGDPVTVSRFKTEEVLKGNAKSSEEGFINVSYLGGTITLEEYMKTQTQEQLEKKGILNISSELRKTQLVKYVAIEAPIELNESNESDKYMLFLNYDKVSDTYALHSNGYGMLKIKDNGYIYNYENNSYEKTSFYTK